MNERVPLQRPLSELPDEVVLHVLFPDGAVGLDEEAGEGVGVAWCWAAIVICGTWQDESAVDMVCRYRTVGRRTEEQPFALANACGSEDRGLDPSGRRYLCLDECMRLLVSPPLSLHTSISQRTTFSMFLTTAKMG